MSGKQVRLCGFGGQGIILAGVLLGHAATAAGKYVAGSGSYGVQARGGYCASDVVIADEPIIFPHVQEADILVAVSQEAYDTYSKDLAAGAVVLYDDQLVTPRPLEGARQVGIGATSCATKDLGATQAANIVMLGALVAVTGVVEREVLARVIDEQVPPRFRELNLKALDAGYQLGAK